LPNRISHFQICFFTFGGDKVVVVEVVVVEVVDKVVEVVEVVIDTGLVVKVSSEEISAKVDCDKAVVKRIADSESVIREVVVSSFGSSLCISSRLVPNFSSVSLT
jgi:hypothetical protein